MTTALAIFGFTLAFIAVVLTCAMFLSRNMMLGFPCVIFWAVVGGYAYGLSVATWDAFYFLYFASFGMAIWSALAMYGLRTRKQDKAEGDELIDETKEQDKYFDEQPASETEVTVSKRTQKLRERAERRRVR